MRARRASAVRILRIPPGQEKAPHLSMTLVGLRLERGRTSLDAAQLKGGNFKTLAERFQPLQVSHHSGPASWSSSSVSGSIGTGPKRRAPVPGPL